MVGGNFDLESNFLVKDSSHVKNLLKFMDHIPAHLEVCETLTIFNYSNNGSEPKKAVLFREINVEQVDIIMDNYYHCSYN